MQKRRLTWCREVQLEIINLSNSKKNKGKYEYIIDDYELNNIYFKTKEEVEQEISDSIEEMVKNGLMDYKVGEDGKFYFELTEKGKKEIQWIL